MSPRPSVPCAVGGRQSTAAGGWRGYEEGHRRGTTVVLDPGHAGRWLGATAKLSDGRTLLEKDLNLKVGLAAAEMLRQAGVKVLLTRTTDAEVNPAGLAADLQACVDLANRAQADAFVSIHFNGGSAGMRGTETFYNANRPFSARSRQLATTLFDRLVAAIEDYDGYKPVRRGVKPDSAATGGAPFYILGPAGGQIARASQMPAALGEGLFLSEPAEAKLLSQGEFLKAIARAYADAVLDYLATIP